MEAVILTGLQGAGKSTFYRQRLFETHLRISLDMLRTRHRERLLVRACLEAKARFVVDNTNPTRQDRARYIHPARAAGFTVTGYFFIPAPEASLARNEERSGRARVPAKAVWATLRRLEAPALEEGYDRILAVEVVPGGGFAVRDWPG